MKSICTLITFVSCILFFSCHKNISELSHSNSETNDEANVLKGASLIYCTSGGFIISVNAVTGAEKWESSVGDKMIADGSPCVADGKVFVTTKYPDAVVYAFDLKNGRQLWSKQLHSNIHGFYTDYGCIYFKDSFIYVPSRIALYRLNANTGEQSWELLDSSGYDFEAFTSPVIINQTVFCTRSAKMYALDATSGNIKWIDSSLYVFSKSSPCVIDNKLFLAPNNPGFEAIDTLGNLLWKYPYADNDGSISPTSRNGLVYTSSYYGGGGSAAYTKKIYALNALNGKLKWKQSFHGHVDNTSYIDINRSDFVTDKFYFVKMNDSLIALSAKNGTVLWGVKSTDETFRCSPVSYGNSVFISSAAGMIAYDINTAQQLWANTKYAGAYAPVIVPANGAPIHSTMSGMTQ